MTLPIGGFMPIPLAMMIPFMATQSIVMGDAFGKAYQFGKRRISSLSNEDFNKLTVTDLISQMQTDFKKAIPSIEKSIDDSSVLQEKIIKEMLLILPRFLFNLGADAKETVTNLNVTVDGKNTTTGNAALDVILAALKGISDPLPETFPETGPTLEGGTTSDKPPPSDAQLFFTQSERDIQAYYSGMTRNTLLNNQPSQSTVYKNDPLHISAWNTAYAKFTATDSPPAELKPDPTVKELAHRISFRGSNESSINRQMTFAYNKTFDGHKAQLDSMRLRLESLSVHRGPSHWSIKSLINNISLYSLEIKKFYGKWA